MKLISIIKYDIFILQNITLAFTIQLRKTITNYFLKY